jgi:hypothetical protein
MSEEKPSKRKSSRLRSSSKAVQAKPQTQGQGQSSVEEGGYDVRKTLSEKQLEWLDKLNELIQNDSNLSEKEKRWCDAPCLARFLRAREFDLEKSHEMLLNCLKWRMEYKPDEVKADDVIVEMKNEGKLYINGKDKFGRPIVYMRPGRDNTGAPEKDVKVKYLVYLMEKGIASMDASKGVEKIVWIIDYKDYHPFALTGMTMLKISKEIADILTNYYPERLGVAFCIRAPWVFSMFWKFVSAFLTDVTKSKLIMISGTDFGPIHEVVDLEVLEEDFGGKNTFKWNFEEHWKKEETSPDQ